MTRQERIELGKLLEAWSKESAVPTLLLIRHHSDDDELTSKIDEAIRYRSLFEKSLKDIQEILCKDR